MPLNKKENERLSFLIVFIHVYSHSYFSCFFPLYEVNIFFIFLFVAVKSNIFRFLLICRLYLTLFIFSFLFLGNHASPVLISSWSIAFVFSVFFSVCIYLFFSIHTHTYAFCFHGIIPVRMRGSSIYLHKKLSILFLAAKNVILCKDT